MVFFLDDVLSLSQGVTGQPCLSCEVCQFNRFFFSRGHDPSTQVRRARSSTDVSSSSPEAAAVTTALPFLQGAGAVPSSLVLLLCAGFCIFACQPLELVDQALMRPRLDLALTSPWPASGALRGSVDGSTSLGGTPSGVPEKLVPLRAMATAWPADRVAPLFSGGFFTRVGVPLTRSLMLVQIPTSVPSSSIWGNLHLPVLPSDSHLVAHAVQ